MRHIGDKRGLLARLLPAPLRLSEQERTAGKTRDHEDDHQQRAHEKQPAADADAV